MMKRVLFVGLLFLFGLAAPGYGQFSSNLQGTVQDPNGAVIPGATLTLTNQATGVARMTNSGAQGDFRILSLAPGAYQLTVTATGFATAKIAVTLETEQTMELPVALKVGSQTQTVQVTGEAPILDTADSRTQLTMNTQALSDLPMQGHTLLTMVEMSPGVTGLGLLGLGNNGQSNDNYSAETTVSASANGRSFSGNMYVADGLDITSDVRPGVLNLVPNPDTVAETTVQVNTYSVEYGRNSSIVEVMTTKSGSDKYHLLLSDYFTNQRLSAGTEFVHSYAPFHTNDISATLGGPIPFLKSMYFFTGWEPLLGLTATGNTTYTFEDPQFTAWAETNFPNNIGTELLKAYPASAASNVAVSKTAAQLFPTTCGTSALANLPCSTPVFDTGVFNASNYRNALQYNVRIDKYFKKDRVYGNYFQTDLQTGGPTIRPGMPNAAKYNVHSVQFNETHTLSTNTLNEAAFGYLRMEGLVSPTGPFHVPIITVTGWSANIGVSSPHENYVQHHEIWRDAFTHIYKGHTLQFGYEGFHGDSNAYFAQWASQPTFSFTNLVNLVEDNVYQETGVYYNLLTGQQAGLAGDSYQILGNANGFYGMDTWKLGRRLTLNYGLRWDDMGNPHPGANSTLADFFYGSGQTITQQVANGFVQQMPNAFLNALNAWSPRAGFALDVTGHNVWVIRGGAGLYHDWVTLGNVQNEFTNPPAPVSETFTTGTGIAPILSLGTSDTYPFGFTYPTIPSTGLNNAGGITGLQSNITANNPNLKPTDTYNYSVNLERSVGRNFTASAGYAGSHSYNLYTDFAGHITNVYYGYDINNFPGSLIQNNGKLVRLNPNFGTIRYTTNGPTLTYNAFIAEFKGRLSANGFVNLSYTRSSAWDDAYTYPTVQSNSGNYKQYWGPSLWDTPNRISLTIGYDLPKLHGENTKALQPLVNGWNIADATVLQSGTPFTVDTAQAFAPVCSSGSPSGGVCPAGTTVVGDTGGDYNADGNNYDFPNIGPGGYSFNTSRHSYLTGVFGTGLTSATVQSVFPVPSFGTEGNELPNRFWNPGYADSDLSLSKSTAIRESLTFLLRFESYNVFNRPNLGGVGGATSSLSSFGIVTSQYNPRFFQIAGKLQF